MESSDEQTARGFNELDRINTELAEKNPVQEFQLLPPPKGHCPVCAVKHPRAAPHNAQSMFYQTAFWMAQRRHPTWADAMAHCDDDTKDRWTKQLLAKGHWSQPEEGEAITHLGSDNKDDSDH